MPQMALFLKLQHWPGVKRGVGSVYTTMPLQCPCAFATSENFATAARAEGS